MVLALITFCSWPLMGDGAICMSPLESQKTKTIILPADELTVPLLCLVWLIVVNPRHAGLQITQHNQPCLLQHDANCHHEV